MDNLMNFSHANFVTFYTFWVTFGTQYNLYIFGMQFVYFSGYWPAIEMFQCKISHTFFMILLPECIHPWNFDLTFWNTYNTWYITIHTICSISLMCILQTLIMTIQNIMSANSCLSFIVISIEKYFMIYN